LSNRPRGAYNWQLMKLRVGLVGLGTAWDKRYKPALRALSDRFEVRAVCEQVAVRAEQAAREFQATPVDSFRALSQRDDVDAILMLAPQWYGPLPILAACDAQKSIFYASALDLDPEQAKRIKQRVEAAGIAFVPEFPRRLAPATLRLKELIATRLGPPRLLFCHHRMAASESMQNHVDDSPQARSTRILMELVDWCRYTVGREPNSVISVKHLVAPEGNETDYEMMSLDFSQGPVATGPVAQVSTSHYLSSAWPEAVTFRPPAALQVACENGLAFIDLPATLTWFDQAGRHMESLESERPVGEQMLVQFHRAVTSLVRSASGLEDAYRALSIVLAARQSQELGSRVAL
jgi:predicted dehydrogenase